MKVCTYCKQLKHLEEFNFKNKAIGRLNSHCKTCSRLLIRAHYNKNRDYYLKKAKERNQTIRARNKRYIWHYLENHPCLDCGKNDPIVLEFDHIGDKTADIARMIRSADLKVIEREIKQCEVRCANCHRRKTALRAGWSKHMPL